MGHVSHDALIATTYSKHEAYALAAFIDSIGCLSRSVVFESIVNSDYTVFIPTSASKTGWGHKDQHVAALRRVIKWMDEARITDGRGSFEWTWVTYGIDDEGSRVVDNSEDRFYDYEARVVLGGGE